MLDDRLSTFNSMKAGRGCSRQAGFYDTLVRVSHGDHLVLYMTT